MQAPVPVSQDKSQTVDIIPAHALPGGGEIEDLNDATDPPVRITPDKSEIIVLPRNAASIILGNPNHVNIVADSANRLVLIARAPGATYFTALDQEGLVIMQRHVIVASPKEKYVRVRKSCAGSADKNCQQTQVFYCPDMCHEIILSTGEDTSSNADEAAKAESDATTGGTGTNTDGAVDENEIEQSQ